MKKSCSKLALDVNPSSGIRETIWDSPWIVFVVTALVMLFIATGYISLKLNDLSNCSGPPYLYVTVHNGGNILKYTRDGCSLTRRAAWYGYKIVKELREMKIGKYMDKVVFYVADSADSADGYESQVIVLGHCLSWNAMRPYVTTAVPVTSQPDNGGAVHAYGITFDKKGNLYVSYQHTDVVVRYAKDSFQPMPFPLSIREQLNQSIIEGLSSKNKKRGATNQFQFTDLNTLYNGTFVQFGEVGVHSADERGIRSIVWVSIANKDEELWIANEDLDRIFIVDSEARDVDSIKIHNPIGMHYDEIRGLVFIGSKSKKVNRGGAVYAINAETKTVVKEFSLLGDGMMHPTGIVTYGDVLFVGEQHQNVILTFNISTGRFLKQILSGFYSDIEHLALSDC